MTTDPTFILPLSASLLPLRPLPRRKDRLRICDQTDQVTCFFVCIQLSSVEVEGAAAHTLLDREREDVMFQ